MKIKTFSVSLNVAMPTYEMDQEFNTWTKGYGNKITIHSISTTTTPHLFILTVLYR